MFYVYTLVSQCDGSSYTGKTNDLKKRILRHNRGYLKVTKRKIPSEIGYFEVFSTRSEAMWREWEFKRRYSSQQKKKMIAEFDRSRITEILENL
ncbi:MAG: GIY-YIG nuclease family protein [Bacteroidota bacterium]